MEKPPPEAMKAPVAGEHTTSVPPPAQGLTPLGLVLHTGLVGAASGVPSTSCVAPTARM